MLWPKGLKFSVIDGSHSRMVFQQGGIIFPFKISLGGRGGWGGGGGGGLNFIPSCI